MTAYLISDVIPRDAEAFELYRTRAAASIAKFGGRYLVRGSPIERLEGSWTPGAIVVVEFPSGERAREWYGSPDYAAALDGRELALTRNLILVEGLPDPR